jgi:hypothetical protein
LLRLPLLPRGRSGALRLALNYLSFIVSAGVLGPWMLRGQRFDAVLVYAPSPILQAIPAIWLAWLKSAPLVTWVQDLWPESLAVTGFVRQPRALAAVAAVVRWIYRHNDLLPTTPTPVKSHSRRRLLRKPPRWYSSPASTLCSLATWERYRPWTL